MEIVRNQKDYLKDADILIRVYDNQSRNHSEEEQCVGEILFKPNLKREHIRMKSWLPKGLANCIVQELSKLKKTNYKIQICNELPDNIGVLTSCRENFENALVVENERERTNLQLTN